MRPLEALLVVANLAVLCALAIPRLAPSAGADGAGLVPGPGNVVIRACSLRAGCARPVGRPGAVASPTVVCLRLLERGPHPRHPVRCGGSRRAALPGADLLDRAGGPG